MFSYFLSVINFATLAVASTRKSRQPKGAAGTSKAVVEGLEPRRLLSTSVPGQTINTPTQWTLAGSPYNLDGGVTIATGGSLQIDSGVTVTYTLYQGSLTVNSGGSLTATGATLNFPITAQNGSVGSITGSAFGIADEFDASSLTLSSDHFNANPSVVPTYVATLASNGNTFASGTVINILGQNVNIPVTLPVITNVSNFNLSGGVTIASGGSLTINSGVTVTYTLYQGGLTINSGGSLNATNATLNFPFTAQNGSLGSITGSAFGSADEFDASSLTLGSDHFNANPSVFPTYVATLASNGNTFASGSVINLLGQNINVPVTLPAITNVSNYNLSGGVTIVSGGALTINSGVTMTYTLYQGGLTVNSGCSLTAVGATFNCPINLAAGSLGLIEYDTFIVANSLNIAGNSGVALHYDDFSNATATVISSGSGGPINMQSNWWGVTSAPLIAAKVTDSADNANLPTIDYSNWLSAKPAISAVIVTTEPVSQTVASGSMVTFTAAALGNPTPTVQWQMSTDGTTFSNIGGATSTTYSFTAGAGQNGYFYRAVFTNSQGSATSSPATLTVTSSASAPVVSLQPASQTVAVGQGVTFTAGASGNPTPTVQWQTSTNGGATFSDISGATSLTYSFAATAGQSGNLFRAVFSNSQGTAITGAATLTVTSSLSTPTIILQPGAVSAVIGQSVSFTAAASGSPTPTVQWQTSTNGSTFSNIAGATSLTYTFTTAANQAGNFFRAVFTNSQGSAITSAAKLTLNSTLSAPAITTQPVSQSAAPGQNVTFSAFASGNPAPSVQWQTSTDGVTFTNISNATSSVYSFVPTSGQSGDSFRAVFTNSQGTATTNPATLTVSTTLTLPAITTQPLTPEPIVAGQSITLTATASGNPTPTVQWQYSNNAISYTDISGATSLTYTFTPTVNESGYLYRAVFSNSSGATTTMAVTISVTAPVIPPTVNIIAPNINAGGGAGQTITIVYNSTTTINTSTINGSNITVIGPNNQTLVVNVFNMKVSGDYVYVTYLVAPPSGTWQVADNGSYSVTVNANAVVDANGVGNTLETTSFNVDATTSLTVAVTTSNLLAVDNQSINLTATLVAGADISPVTTGIVTFFSDGVIIGTAPVGADGTATLVTSPLAEGSHAIAVSYGGDNAHPAVSSGTPFLQKVTQPLALTAGLAGALPAIIVAGQKTSITQTISILNSGTTLYSGGITMTAYLSTGTTVDSSAINLHFTASKIYKLKPMAHSPVHFKLTALPVGMPTGVYHLLIVLQDGSGNTSVSASAGTMSVQAARIDLSGTIVKPPATAKAGKKITASLVVANSGNVLAHGSLLIVCYSSTDNALDQNAAEVKRLSKPINIKPGKTTRIQLSGIILSASAGQHYLIVQLDPNNAFGDVNLNNNVIASTVIAVV